jgi:hypothetical protein
MSETTATKMEIAPTDDAHLPRSPEFLAAMGKLNVRQQKFVSNVLHGVTASESYRRAYGCSPAAAGTSGSNSLRKPNIKAALDAARADLARSIQYDAAAAMAELDESLKFSRETKNATAYARSVELKMRLSGLLIERVDQRNLGAFKIEIGGIDG